MQSSWGFFSTSTSLYFTDGGGLTPSSLVTIPIDAPSPSDPIPIPVHLPATAASAAASAAAVKIQSAYRAHLISSLVRRVREANAGAARFERLIRQQETVDAVRRDERERLRVSEGLMALLLRLDEVPGFYPAVRELRRSVSRRIVALQELLDAIVGESVSGLEGFPSTWEEVVCGVGGGERGGEREIPVEWEEKRGLRCLERLLQLGGY